MTSLSYNSKYRHRTSPLQSSYSREKNWGTHKIISQDSAHLRILSPRNHHMSIQQQNRILSEKLTGIISENRRLRTQKYKNVQNNRDIMDKIISPNRSKYEKILSPRYRKYEDNIQKLKEKYGSSKKDENNIIYNQKKIKNKQIGNLWLKQESKKIMDSKAKYQLKRKNYDPTEKMNIKNKDQFNSGFQFKKDDAQANLIRRQKYFRQQSEESRDSGRTQRKKKNYLYLNQCREYANQNTKRQFQQHEAQNSQNNFKSIKEQNIFEESKKCYHKQLKCDVYLQKSTIFIDQQHPIMFQEESFGGSKLKKELYACKSEAKFQKNKHEKINTNTKTQFKLQTPQFTPKQYFNIKPNKLKTDQNLKRQQLTDKTNQGQKIKKTNKPYVLQHSDFKLKQPKTELKKLKKHAIASDQNYMNFCKGTTTHVSCQIASTKQQLDKRTINDVITKKEVERSVSKIKHKKTYLTLISKSAAQQI